MNVRESNELNALLRWVLAGSNPTAPNAGKAKQAAEFLASRASQTLHAGIGPDDVTAAWPTSAREAVSTDGA